MISKADMNRVGIEIVTVNGMQMFKRRDRLFLTAEHAFYWDYSQERRAPDTKYEMDSRCKCVPYKQDDNIFEKIGRGEVLHALVRF